MDIFQVLADPTRRQIVETLAQKGKLSATDISNNFTMSKPAISQHLKVLREAHLVDMEKHAQQRLYRVNPDSFSDLEQWVKKMKQQWEVRFDALDRVLDAEKRKLALKENHHAK